VGSYWVICEPVLLIDWLGYGGDDCSADFIIGSDRLVLPRIGQSTHLINLSLLPSRHFHY